MTALANISHISCVGRFCIEIEKAMEMQNISRAGDISFARDP
jgi:hypothetical protein